MKAKRANVLLTIKEEEVERYFKQGFDILDDKENLIKKAIPSDVGELQIAYVQHIGRIKELEAELNELKAKKAKEKSVKEDKKSKTEE